MDSTIKNITNNVEGLLNKNDILTKIRAFYIVGSIGMRCYTKGKSDFDFIIVSQETNKHYDFTEFLNELSSTLFPIKTEGMIIFFDGISLDTQMEYNTLLWDNRKCIPIIQKLSPYECYCLKYHKIIVCEKECIDIAINDSILHDYFERSLHTYWVPLYNELMNDKSKIQQDQYEWYTLGIGRLLLFQKHNVLLPKESVAKELKCIYPQESIYFDELLNSRMEGKYNYIVCTSKDVLRLMKNILCDLGISL